MKIRDDYHKFGAILDLIQQLCKPMSGMTYEEIMSFMGCSRKTAEVEAAGLLVRFLTGKYINKQEGVDL